MSKNECVLAKIQGIIMTIRIQFLWLAVFLTSFSMTQAQPTDWENPGVIGINKLPPHATLTPYADLPRERVFMSRLKLEF